MLKNLLSEIRELRFKIRSKRRLYIVGCDFEGDKYDLYITGVFGKIRKDVDKWTEISIETNPLDFARQQIERFEKREDYLDQYDDGLFYLNEEAEQVARQEEESRTKAHKVVFSDWETGKKGVFTLETEEKEEKTS